MPQKRCSSQSSDSSVEILDKRSKNRSKKQDHQFKTSSSSSPEPNRKSKNKISELDQERTKNYDFTDEVNELHSNEKLRQKRINKLEQSDGFQPQSFKSSRSDKKRNESSSFKSNMATENIVFGTSASISDAMTRNADFLIASNVLKSSNKSIMSDLFFEDSKLKQDRWKLKVKGILETL